jgi:hypothetical protein
MAVNFVVVAIPVFYLFRRARLNRKHRPEIRKFKAFAAADPDQLIHEAPSSETASEEPREETPEAAIEEGRWYAVLGVLPSATIEEVKQAYKMSVKKNHPDLVHEVSVCRCNGAKIRFLRSVASHGEIVSSINRSQELDLRVQAQFPDFIQEQAPTVRDVQVPRLVHVGACEGPLLVAEEFALQEILRDGSAVDRHEFLMAPAAQFVNRASDEFFARTGLAEDADAGIGACRWECKFWWQRFVGP